MKFARSICLYFNRTNESKNEEQATRIPSNDDDHALTLCSSLIHFEFLFASSQINSDVLQSNQFFSTANVLDTSERSIIKLEKIICRSFRFPIRVEFSKVFEERSLSKRGDRTEKRTRKILFVVHH